MASARVALRTAPATPARASAFFGAAPLRFVAAPHAGNACRTVTCMAKKGKDVRLMITLECTEQKATGVGGISRYTSEKARPAHIEARVSTLAGRGVAARLATGFRRSRRCSAVGVERARGVGRRHSPRASAAAHRCALLRGERARVARHARAAALYRGKRMHARGVMLRLRVCLR